MKSIKQRQQGFTIIEVMIVLVIAAVILLIVFLAVPALQRNSRNTQRKSDIAGLLAGANEAAGNAGGQYPTTISGVTDNVKLGFYKTANITMNSMPVAAVTNGTTDQSVVVVTGAKCNGTDTTPSTRQVAILFTVENGAGSGTKICQDS